MKRSEMIKKMVDVWIKEKTIGKSRLVFVPDVMEKILTVQDKLGMQPPPYGIDGIMVSGWEYENETKTT